MHATYVEDISLTFRLRRRTTKFLHSEFELVRPSTKILLGLGQCPLRPCSMSTSFLGDSFFHSDEQPELSLENDYPIKTGYSLKTNSSISIL